MCRHDHRKPLKKAPQIHQLYDPTLHSSKPFGTMLAAGDSLSLQRVEIQQAGRIAGPQPFELKAGARASLVCWAVMPSGTLRHLLSGLGLK